MTSRLSATLILGALGALGVVVWSGCGTGSEARYYCDSAGCYQCDAYGCSSVVAPTHATCTGDSSCPTGQVCTTSGCTSACTSDATCPQGETCQAGYCAAPGADAGTAKGCTSKTDCAAGQTCTAAGACQSCGGTAGACSCTTAAECGDGFSCVLGACTATSNTCHYSSECASGKLCVDGACLTSCTGGTCDNGFACVNGACAPTTTSGDGGSTAPVSCSDTAPCATGYYCNQGSCSLDTRPTPNCTTDDQCGGTAATPKRCVGGFCKYSCSTDSYCRTIDSRIGYCAKDLVCRTAAEANAACTGAGQCPNGGSCVDNQCK